MDEERDFEEEESLNLPTPSDVINKHKFQHNPIRNGMRMPAKGSSGLEKQVKKKAIKSGVSAAAGAAGVPVPITEGVMSSPIGDDLVDYAAEQPTAAAGIATIVQALASRTWISVIIGSSGLFFFLFIIIVIFLLKNTDNMNYAAGNLFVNEDYKKIYADVENVVSEYQSKYSVTVDKYLILAALTAYQDNSMYYDKTEEDTYDEITVEEDTGDGVTISKTVDQMTAQIEILAKYQIKTYTDNSGKCYNDDTKRGMAKNDDATTLFNFWKSAAAKEKNYDCSGGYGYALSIDEGKIDDENSGSAFYWNLIDEDFLKTYYEPYFSKITDPELYEQHAAETVEYIYLYAQALRELDCSNSSSSAINTNLISIEVSCPSIEVKPDANGKYGGTYQLEEYVAGVIADEFSPSYMKSAPGVTDEAVKTNLRAFAIAIRSYTISRTNGCTKSIRNSSSDQNFQPTENALIWEAVNETAGMVLTYNGKIISAEYDSWNCKSSTSCTYRKTPGATTHVASLPSNWLKKAAGGHGRGMSQWGALYLATQGKNYQEVVKYWYDDAVQLQQLAGTSPSSGGVNSTAYCQRNVATDGAGICDGTTVYKKKEIGQESLQRPMTLLSCTATQAEQAFKEIADACGKIPHAGSMRGLNADVGEHRSATSFHYTGRAFDFAVGEGLQNKNTYFYVTLDNTSGNDNKHYYRLYCKVTGTTSSEHAAERTITPAYYTKSTSSRFATRNSVTGNFLDVTAVLNKYGLYGIGPRSCYKTSNNSMCTEWWHFQDTSGLQKGKTTFRQTLDQLYGKGYNYSGTGVAPHLNKKWNGGSFS